MPFARDEDKKKYQEAYYAKNRHAMLRRVGNNRKIQTWGTDDPEEIARLKAARAAQKYTERLAKRRARYYAEKAKKEQSSDPPTA